MVGEILFRLHEWQHLSSWSRIGVRYSSPRAPFGGHDLAHSVHQSDRIVPLLIKLRKLILVGGRTCRQFVLDLVIHDGSQS
jgi:hypothetical protein